MPEISRFLGIVIRMHYRDHAPPHFHGHYGDYEVTIDIESGGVNGSFPRRALGVVLEWQGLNREALLENWRRAVNREMLPPIPGLE